MLPTIGKFKANHLPVGTIVKCRVLRSSSSLSSWAQRTNQYHGEFTIRAEVVLNPVGNKALKLHEGDKEELRRARGREVREQNVCVIECDDLDAVTEIITLPPEGAPSQLDWIVRYITEEKFPPEHLKALSHIVALFNECEESEREIFEFAEKLYKKYAE